MNLCCSICTETIGPGDELNVTPCGHMFHIQCLNQWLVRAKTCPQCRHRCTSVIRLYLNVSLNETVRDDPLTLQNSNDSLKLQVRKLEAERRKALEDLDTSKSTQKKARRTIVELEAQLEQKEMLIRAQEAITNEIKNTAKRVPDLEREIRTARQHFATLEAIDNVVKSTVAEVEAVMKNGHSIRSLSTMVVVLKREIRASEKKRLDMRKSQSSLQMDLKHSREQESQLSARISALESDLAKALDDIRTATAAGTMPPKRAFPAELASPEQKSPTVPGARLNAAKNTPKEVGASAAAASEDGSDSPYLKIAASSIGLAAIPKNRPKVSRLSSHSVESIHRGEAGSSSSGTAQFSIFKKARLTEPLSTLRNTNRVFNGLGGTDRRDVFATFSRSDSQQK